MSQKKYTIDLLEETGKLVQNLLADLMNEHFLDSDSAY